MTPSFTPAWWLPGPHLQTLWGVFCRCLPGLQRERERLWLDDGDFLDIDWHGPHDAEAPVVLILHGLTGSSSSHYVIGLQQRLAAQGWASAALNWRGCSGEPNLLARGYHSGVSEDVVHAITHLQRKRPLAPLHAVGYSLGGNVLLKYLGETGARSGLQAAAAVSVPFRLDHCADRVDQGFSKVYQRHFIRNLVAYVRDKRMRLAEQGHVEHVETLDRLGSLENLRTFWDFDGRFTAPLHGYVDADDYYRRASSRYYLGRIVTPTLLIQSSDDPFVFPHSVPTADELSASTELELHPRGGHVGFVGGSLARPRYYLEERISEWMQAVTSLKRQASS